MVEHLKSLPQAVPSSIYNDTRLVSFTCLPPQLAVDEAASQGSRRWPSRAMKIAPSLGLCVYFIVGG